MSADMEPSTTTKSLLPLVLTPVTLHTYPVIHLPCPGLQVAANQAALSIMCAGCHSGAWLACSQSHRLLLLAVRIAGTLVFCRRPSV